MHCCFFLASNKRRTGTLVDPSDQSPNDTRVGIATHGVPNVGDLAVSMYRSYWLSGCSFSPEPLILGQVTDIDHMCFLVDALRPDEAREVITRRGHLNVVNPVFADRYYRLDLGVWDEREMAKVLIRLVSCFTGRCIRQLWT